ncbi:NADH-quinone oxidoreductase subunit M [Rickettsiella grylli]|uniref:complex I subunit 4 family protein n=1 Tax=Rickettsiella grylli TaxID=59196 RepID=UPI0008FCFD23|nr:NADH-quinone oxidoreductase subunit M [Rickettsiella grylli]OIZ99839.1 NADH-quinone oxidoreductase subunit M [Rickettsiella grylli]
MYFTLLALFIHNHLLSLLIWLPVFGGILAVAVNGDRYPQRARVVALTTSLITLVFCIPLYLGFNPAVSSMQFQENIDWITVYHIHYALGVDGISLPLILLTVFTTLLVILAAWHSIKLRVAQYMAAFLLMQGMMVGTFASTDSILFYVFWEAILIPMYLSIGVWGSDNRSYASIKFFLYTFFGSALMLIALLYLGVHNPEHDFLIAHFYPLPLGLSAQIWIFVAFLIAFAVKIPMWPFHTWLPDAHTEAPAGGSVVLAALMLKLGGYGFLRFTLPIVPDASRLLAGLMIVLALIAIVYIGFVALAQIDMKRLIAYSSIAHMGFVVLGCFMLFAIMKQSHNTLMAYMSLEGAMVQMISHAFSSGAMFLAVGMLAYRFRSRLIKDYGGLATNMPLLASFFMLFSMSNLGLPGTSGFVGEFMIILSAMQASFWITAIAATTLILSATYTLYMYKRIFFGEITNPRIAESGDIHGFEKLVFILLSFAILFIGIYPAPLLTIMHTSVDSILQWSLQTKL